MLTYDDGTYLLSKSDGTNITTNNDGTYKINTSSGNQLMTYADGTFSAALASGESIEQNISTLLDIQKENDIPTVESFNQEVNKLVANLDNTLK